jgi:hypothetical protein
MSVLSLSGSVTAADATAYTSALLDLAGDDPLAVLRRTPGELEALVAGVDDARLTRPERAGKWSMRDVVQHLADSELVGGFRLRLILAQERPPIAGYDQDLWVERLRYRDVSMADAMEQFRVLRRLNLRLWSEATPADLERVGVHGERGQESLEYTRRLYAGHDVAHLRQLARIRRAVEPSAQ